MDDDVWTWYSGFSQDGGGERVMRDAGCGMRITKRTSQNKENNNKDIARSSATNTLLPAVGHTLSTYLIYIHM